MSLHAEGQGGVRALNEREVAAMMKEKKVLKEKVILYASPLQKNVDKNVKPYLVCVLQVIIIYFFNSLEVNDSFQLDFMLVWRGCKSKCVNTV